jgi:hypothetical protein
VVRVTRGLRHSRARSRTTNSAVQQAHQSNELGRKTPSKPLQTAFLTKK